MSLFWNCGHNFVFLSSSLNDKHAPVRGIGSLMYFSHMRVGILESFMTVVKKNKKKYIHRPLELWRV